MSCTRPLKAYWADQGRTRIVFDINRSRTRVSFSLPCSQCLGCKLNRAADWGMRCLHEKKMWSCNSYVTLTYNDASLPKYWSLSLDDVQLFMKRLRWAKKSCKGNPLRFFMGGEYGEENGRPHYHALLFNCGFPDMLFHSYNKRGEPLYTSKELSDLWGKGFATIGEVTFDSAVYCAKYALKKINVSKASTPEARAEYDRKYLVIDEDGVCYGRRPEFAIMSRRPGIGRAYYEKFGAEVRAHDSVVLGGREVRPARYYDVCSGEVDPEGMERRKRERKRVAVLNRSDNTPERLRVKERLMEIAAERKERKL